MAARGLQAFAKALRWSAGISPLTPRPPKSCISLQFVRIGDQGVLIAPEIGFENQMNTAKADQPISAFQALGLRYLYATMAALFAVALALAFVLRQAFQSESLMGISNLITAHWPKLDADRQSLLRINGGFSSKFAPVMCAACAHHLLVKMSPIICILVGAR